jgi:hypothetical protein
MSFERFNATGPVSTAAQFLENPRGDQGLDRLQGGSILKMRCRDCRRPIQAYVPATQQVMSKVVCRNCDYLHEVQVRPKTMDRLEEHLDEGAYEARVRARTDGSRGTTRPSIHLSRKEQIMVEERLGVTKKVRTPWGDGTLIGC